MQVRFDRALMSQLSVPAIIDGSLYKQQAMRARSSNVERCLVMGKSRNARGQGVVFKVRAEECALKEGAIRPDTAKETRMIETEFRSRPTKQPPRAAEKRRWAWAYIQGSLQSKIVESGKPSQSLRCPSSCVCQLSGKRIDGDG